MAGNCRNLSFRGNIYGTFLVASVITLSWGSAAFAAPKVGSVTVGPQVTSPGLIPGSTTNQIIITRGTGGGSSGTFKADLSVTNSLPTGVTVTFIPASRDFASSEDVVTGQMVVATSSAASPGTFTVCVKCVKNGDSTDSAVSCDSLSFVGTNAPTCAVSGPSNTCPNATGLMYTDTTDAFTPSFSWSVTGNGSISGASTNASVTVNAGAPGSFTVTCLVIDLANGKSNTCSQLVTFADSTPPTITQCATNLLGTANGSCQAAVPSFTNAVVASDTCGAITVSQSPIIGTLVGLGTNTVTIGVADANGNTNICTAAFIVRDLTPPTIICPADVSVNVDDGECFASGVVLGTPTTGDNCGVANVGNDAPTSFPAGDTIVTWTVTDVHGNTNTCQQTVTVTENEAPTITCPADVAVDTDTDACSASGVDLGTPVTSDNCGVASVTNDASASFPIGTNTVTWTATDNSGNAVTCQQLVIVADNQPPTITCPADIITNLVGSCSITNLDLGTPVTADNCGVASVVNDAPAEYFAGTTNVLWTVTDIHGNSATCTQSVTVVDDEAPMISCPSNVTVSADAGLCTASGVDLGSPIASDNCGGVTVTNDAPAAFPVGDTIVIWTATDDGGNTNTCQQTVTVTDDEAPTISCPSDVATNTDAGVCSASGVALGTPTTDDNCGVADVSNDAPATFPVGDTVVIWTVVDIHGNSNSCQQTVTVADNEAPTITCPADVAVSTDAGVCTASGVALGTPTTGDNCGVASVTNDAPASFPAGDTIVTWTVTDVHGNTNTCQQMVTVTENEAPTIACPGDIVVTVPLGSNSVSGVNLGTPISGDNCGVASVTNDAPSSFPIGDTIVTWTVTDTSGNTATCQQTVTVVEGNVAPVANDDSYMVAEDDTLDVAAPGVLANDTGDGPLTAVLVSNTTHGALTLQPDGSFSYMPDNNFNGIDSFTYTANDGSLTSGVATVTITVGAVDGAGDIDLYAKTASFGMNWTTTDADRFKIKGKINPRGAKTDLTGATMQISINGTNLFAPVTLDSSGRGAVTVGSAKVKASFSSATGLYSFSISGIDLRAATGLVNVSGTGNIMLDVTLTIAGAMLDIPEISGQLETPFTTTADKSSKGKFVFKKDRTLTGAFNWNKTTAAQLKDGTFKVTGKGVAEAEGGAGIAPTGNTRVTIGGAVFTVPAADVQFVLDGTKRTFKIGASGLVGTGIPLASANAPTEYELPIMFEVPVVGGTNIFETIIELKRPDGTSTKWKR
jgi:VCBS repeat-containing protein